MGWRGTIFLGAALLGAAYLLSVEVAGKGGDGSWRSVFELPRPTPPSEQITRLLSFDPANVSGIRVRHGERTWSVRRGADGWQNVERPGAVDDFLTDVRELAEIMPLEVAPNQLADHGLEPPASTIEIDRSDGPPLVLLVGARNPPATGVYVQIGQGGRVVLTGALLLWNLDKATRAIAPSENHEATKE